MKIYCKILLIPILSICLIGISMNSFSQYQIGNSIGRNAGVDALNINPALIHFESNYIDLRVVSGQFSVQNNYVYLPNTTIFSTLRNGFVDSLNNRNLLDNYTSNDKNAYFRLFMGLPSFSIRLNNVSLAYHSNFETWFSVEDLPYHVAKFVFDGTDFEAQQNKDFVSDPYSLTMLSYHESTFYGATKLDINTDGLISIGGGISIYNGLGMLSLENIQMSYNVQNDNLVEIENFNANIAFSLPVDNETNERSIKPLQRGIGLGINFGMDYLHEQVMENRKRMHNPLEKYNYRFRAGFAFKDIGYIRFTKDTEHHRIGNRPADWEGIEDFRYHNLNQFSGEFSQQFYGNKYESYFSDKYSVFLPSRLQLYFDYQFIGGVYLNTLLIAPLGLGKHHIKPPAVIAITPRYDIEDFTVQLPFSLYQFKKPHLGFSIRYKYVTIGTDHLLMSSGISKFYGFDIYASVKLSLAKK